MHESLCIMQVQNWKCCHIKLWRIIKESSVSTNIICTCVYCGLYTMTIDVVTGIIILKCCIWSFHLRNFPCLPVFVLFLQKLCELSRNSSNFIYIYLKLKLGTEKHIRLKWVFLPQWSLVGGPGRNYVFNLQLLGIELSTNLFIKQITIIGWQTCSCPDIGLTTILKTLNRCFQCVP